MIALKIILKADSNSETNDRLCVFPFYSQLLAKGLIGLLLAVIMSAAMSSTASGLNALASTCSIYKRNLKPKKSDKHYLNATKFSRCFGE
jgi:Na+/proline symporter